MPSNWKNRRCRMLSTGSEHTNCSTPPTIHIGILHGRERSRCSTIVTISRKRTNGRSPGTIRNDSTALECKLEDTTRQRLEDDYPYRCVNCDSVPVLSWCLSD